MAESEGWLGNGRVRLTHTASGTISTNQTYCSNFHNLFVDAFDAIVSDLDSPDIDDAIDIVELNQIGKPIHHSSPYIYWRYVGQSSRIHLIGRHESGSCICWITPACHPRIYSVMISSSNNQRNNHFIQPPPIHPQ